ncbi:FAD-binding oxidoreductase [Flavihumibacter rivuli]|uniref:FAD-binding and (Fe-S)-binding domain-containing protein n=1 Tax=Flavihumibacter rivuli TaxID=2838156 RepID=UPI001EFBD259|nr:FAD-binding and (Fe-S)-binding domain-containing protein [Flavihumibacter rivuli]ULQ55755.1 FAD-binding oxidoreductase [Flavihumibacter rivuli]
MKPEDYLARILPQERVKTSLVDRIAYANDAGFYHLIPKAVVQPVGVDEVRELFRISREQQIPLCFRAGGTSLSGQSITDGILVDLSKHWRKVEPLEQGRKVRVEPGVTGAMVNTYLKSWQTKIGPDPSSINAAMMGGILSNNASGMCCGVAYNSYHTLASLRFVLPDGNCFDTANTDDYARFEKEEKVLHDKLVGLRERIAANPLLEERIRKKYRTKNTVGYSLNALVDYLHPLDIFAHLLIGAEGTLGFIAEAVLHTIPNPVHNATAILYFDTIRSACAAITPLKDSGAAVLELMDRASLRSVENLKGLPAFFRELPESAAGILCEYQASSPEELEKQLAAVQPLLQELPLLHAADFTRDPYTREFYWKIRKGMFPSVGAVRASGTTVILEDIAFPVEQLADAVIDLQQLFRDFGYDNAIIFGHAKDGNLHFVVTQLLEEQKEIDRYDRFIRALVELVLKKYDGALKAEHGTGRNMAPFVEAEWGGEAYAIMKELKACVDPGHLLNPGVIINQSAEAHIQNLKQMPSVEAEVDKCIECGFCEHHCPSKDVTLTPRQRIQVRRQLQLFRRQGNEKDHRQLLKEYQYAGLDTCATDGLCQSDCPVSINTGELVKRLRREQHGSFSNGVANFLSRNFSLTETMTRGLVRAGVGLNKVFGPSFMGKMTGMVKRVLPKDAAVPQWWDEIGAAPKQLVSEPSHPQVVYFTACIHRVMGNRNGRSLQESFIRVSRAAGMEVLLPRDIQGHCCGQPFSSKGFKKAAGMMEEKTIDALLRWTDNGRLPVVCDFTSCTYTLLHNADYFSAEYKEKFSRLRWMDIIQYLEKEIVPRITVKDKRKEVVLHPTCSTSKLLLGSSLQKVAAACADQVVVPVHAGCCGMAGDRGFLFPELTNGATKEEVAELPKGAGSCYSTGLTCEMALEHASGKPYEHLLFLLDDVI